MNTFKLSDVANSVDAIFNSMIEKLNKRLNISYHEHESKDFIQVRDDKHCSIMNNPFSS